MGNLLAAILVCLLTVAAHAKMDPCDFQAPTRINQADTELAKKVETIFSNTCKKCHGLGQVGGAAVMTDIMNRDLLVRESMVSLTDPPSSKLMKAINRPTRWMPLGGAQLPDGDKTAILEWIEKGAPDWKGAPSVNDPILNHSQEIECIAHDQSKFDSKDAYYVRYLTFGHVKGNDFVMARDGAIKLLNHLTFANQPKAPTFVDKLGKILRVDLRDYAPNFDFTAWEKYVIPGYPYAYVSEDDKLFNFYVEKVNKYAYSERAFVRGDWFIAQAGQSPVYEKVMRLPHRLEDLEKVLGIDAQKDLLYGYAKRGSVSKSGVANYPRLIDRFEFDFIGAGSAQGLHWITRDFNGDKGTRNIYAFPFGPRLLPMYAGWDAAKFFANKVFENDAGESITQLPNGFQFYGIWDAKNNFINKADPHIAVSKTGLYRDDVVRNPMSCFQCHNGGVNQWDDDSVIKHVNASPGFTVDEVKFANELFFTPDQRHESLGKHIAAFKKAMETIGLNDPNYLTLGGEPTSQAFKKFDDYMSCTDLAWELGIPRPKLVDYLLHSPDLARQLGLADCDTGKLSRENYEHLFDKVVREFDIGFQVKIGGGGVVVDKCNYVFTNRSNRTVRFKAFNNDLIQLNHSQTKAYEFTAKTNGLVSNLQWWSGNGWWTLNKTYNVADCRNYAFLWNGSVEVFPDGVAK